MSDAQSICAGTITIAPLLNAQQRLHDALAVAKSDLEKTGAIKCFEFCLELSWRVMKRVLAYRGTEENSPREVIRAAAKDQLIEDPERWFGYLELRNLTSHTYQHKYLETVYEQLPDFDSELNSFVETLKKL